MNNTKMFVHLAEAKLCLNCETIHQYQECPVCCSENCLLLSKVLNRKAA